VTPVRRRTFLLGTAAIAGGVAIGGWWAMRPPGNPLEDAALDEGEVTLNPYVLVTRDGVSVVTPRAEMGQGVHTTLAALVAEEMDLDWTQVRAIHGPASVAYANPKIIALGLPFADYEDTFVKDTAAAAMEIGARLMRMQVTGGSTSTVDGFEKMRRAGAAARAVLAEAAARRLGLPAARLRTESGAVLAPDGERIPYPELAEEAALVELAADPPLKPRSQWRLLGRSLPRLDMAAKVQGTATFGIDIRLPGMLYAAIRANPHLGGAMLSFDAAAAERMPGVVRVLPIGDPVPNAVAAVARNTWAAMRAIEAVEVDWGPAPYPPDTEAIFARIAQAFDQPPQMALRDEGDVEDVLAGRDVLRAEYRAPYLAHATMEPMTATALFRDGRLTLWTGSQAPTSLRDQAAALAGIEPDAVSVETTFLGGGFGRRFETDAPLQAVQIALAMPNIPVKLSWSREEDIRHDFYRPGAIARMAGLPGPDAPLALSAAIAGASLSQTQIVRQTGIAPPGPDKFLVEGAFDQPYAIPHFRVAGHVSDVAVPVGFWRSVGYSTNAFFLECFLDELAHAAGLDPAEMRLRLLRPLHPVSATVVETVAEMAGWGTPLPAERARGLAFCMSYGSPTAQVVQVARTEGGIAVERVWCAQDVGTALDPRNIEAQIQSGIVFGLSAAIMGEITFAEGAVQQSNFHDYDALRMDRTPAIEARILQNGAGLGGVGEPATPPVAPALGNALFALTGRRIRRLPFARSIVFA
jgi:isoquinoline 1-oxidoreductase subunit beta